MQHLNCSNRDGRLQISLGLKGQTIQYVVRFNVRVRYNESVQWNNWRIRDERATNDTQRKRCEKLELRLRMKRRWWQGHFRPRIRDHEGYVAWFTSAKIWARFKGCVWFPIMERGEKSRDWKWFNYVRRASVRSQGTRQCWNTSTRRFEFEEWIQAMNTALWHVGALLRTPRWAMRQQWMQQKQSGWQQCQSMRQCKHLVMSNAHTQGTWKWDEKLESSRYNTIQCETSRKQVRFSIDEHNVGCDVATMDTQGWKQGWERMTRVRVNGVSIDFNRFQ